MILPFELARFGEETDVIGNIDALIKEIETGVGEAGHRRETERSKRLVDGSFPPLRNNSPPAQED